MSAIALFAAGELSAREWITPSTLGAERFEQLYPAFDYGFSDMPVCFPDGDEIRCAANPYVRVFPSSFARDKRPGERRIFAIGNSVCRGKPGTNYLTYLGELLSERHRGADVTTVNLCALSLGSTRQLPRLEEALRHAPDLVLVHVHGINEKRDERARAYRDELHDGLAGLALRSQQVVLMKKLFTEVTGLDKTPAAELDASGESGDSWGEVTSGVDQNVATMVKMAAAAQVPLVLVGTFDREAGFESSHARAINDLLRRQSSRGARFFDAAAVLREARNESRRRVLRDHVHLSERGHRVLAAALAPVAEQALKLP